MTTSNPPAASAPTAAPVPARGSAAPGSAPVSAPAVGLRIGRFGLRASTLRAMRDGALVACVVLALAHLLLPLDFGVDAYTYWAIDPAAPYTSSAPGTANAFFYSPAFAQLTAPIHSLPWNVFIAAWTIALTFALLWQSGRLFALALLLAPVFVDMTVGNLHIVLGAAILAGFRWPWAWSLLLLTKITPGVGVLWFAFRREWRSLFIALGATGAVAAASFLYRPDLWRAWLDLLVAATGAPDWQFIVPIPVWFRLPVSVAILFWGARTDRRWTVPLASCLALPVLWFNGFAMLVAMLPLLPVGAETPAARWLRGDTRQGVATTGTA